MAKKKAEFSENTVKTLIKKQDISLWREALADDKFVDFVQSFRDKSEQTVLHLLAKCKTPKAKETLDDFAFVALVEVLPFVPLDVRNKQGKLPSEVLPKNRWLSWSRLFFREQTFAKPRAIAQIEAQREAFEKEHADTPFWLLHAKEQRHFF